MTIAFDFYKILIRGIFMKFLRGQILLVVVLLSSVMSMEMNAAGMPQGRLQSWWKSTYFTDYLPNWVQSFIPRARVRQMFYGVVSYSEKIRKMSLAVCNDFKMKKLVQNYYQWMLQYKDIINEGTIFSGLSKSTGNPDSVLGLWKIIFAMHYEIDENNTCILTGIKTIINNLEAMGAKVNSWEKGMLEPVSSLVDNLSM
jgi:hypothetical protein